MPTQQNRRPTIYGYPSPQTGLQQEPIVQQRAPTESDTAEIGTIWIDQASQSFYILCDSNNGVNTWASTSGGSETLTALTVNPGNITLTAGDMNITAGDLNMSPTSVATLGAMSAGNTTLTASLGVTGAATFGSTVHVTGAVTLASSLDVQGNVTVEGDFDITSAQALSFTTTANVNPAISFTTNGGTNESIKFTSNQGTSNSSLDFVSVAGGITLDAGKASPNAITMITNGAGGITIDYGSAGMAIDSATNGAFSVLTGTGAIGLSTDAAATTINIGTGAAVKTVAIGGTGANVITIGNTQTAGSVAIGTAMTTGTINIGGTGAQTGTISIAPGTGVQTVNIATGGTGAKTINLGTAAVANQITIGHTTAGSVLDLNSDLVDIESSGNIFIEGQGEVNISSFTADVAIFGGTQVEIDASDGGSILIGGGSDANITTAIGSVQAGGTLALVTPPGTNVVAANGLSITTAGRGLSLPGGVLVLAGAGDPDGAVNAPTGSLFLRTDQAGATSRLYVKDPEDATSWVNITCAS